MLHFLTYGSASILSGTTESYTNSYALPCHQAILRNLYQEFYVEVRVGGIISTDGRLEQWLKQGGVLSPSMFILFMEDKIRMQLASQKAPKIGGKQVPVVAYVDGEVLISSDPNELQEMLQIS